MMTKKKEIELARKFFDLIFREVENGEDVIYDFIDPECRYKTLCDKLNNETVKEVLELGFKQKYGEEWHGGKGEQDNVDSLYDAKAVGNAVAMHEALVGLAQAVQDFMATKGRNFYPDMVIALDAAAAALAAPARNCDVGTVSQQAERFKEYCASNMEYYRDMFGEGVDGWDCREDCPIGKMIDKNDSLCDHCELAWAQMPYEEGEE